MTKVLKALEQLDKEQAAAAFDEANKLAQNVRPALEAELRDQVNSLWATAAKRVGLRRPNHNLVCGSKHRALANRVRNAGSYLRRRTNRKIARISGPKIETFYRYADLWRKPTSN